MTETIKAGEKPLVDVFCDKFVFRIPPYQRPYAWTPEEAGELFDDLLTALDASDPAHCPPYFLGSIVLIKDSQKPEADVVDGQQRLTTLTILLAVLRDLATTTELHDDTDDFIRQKGSQITKSADRYIERLKEEGGKNIKTKRRQLDQHLIPFFAARPVSQIGSFDVERYKKERRLQGDAPATVNRELAVLSHLFNKSVEWGLLKALPAKIRRFKEENARIVYLTEAQCAALLDAAARDQNDNVHAFVMVGLRTGMRHSEILAIRRCDIHLDRNVIWIPEAKAGAREQPITRDLADYLALRLEMLPPGCEWLFPSPGSRTGHVHAIRKAFRRSAQRAGLDPDTVMPHTLRHTVVTHLVQAGVDLPTVQRISGHKTLTMVARYAHQSGTHIQTAMSKLEMRLDGSDDASDVG